MLGIESGPYMCWVRHSDGEQGQSRTLVPPSPVSLLGVSTENFHATFCVLMFLYMVCYLKCVAVVNILYLLKLHVHCSLFCLYCLCSSKSLFLYSCFINWKFILPWSHWFHLLTFMLCVSWNCTAFHLHFCVFLLTIPHELHSFSKGCQCSCDLWISTFLCSVLDSVDV